jgi:hypothetical protein
MCSRSLLVTAALLCVPLLLPPPPAAGQVTIHETAVIDPGRRAPGADPGGSLESLISPCNPPYDDPGPPVITRRAVFPGERLSLAALTCPGCPAHHMAGELTQGTGYVRLELTRPPGLGGEINGTSFHFREAWGYDVVAVFDQGIPEDSVVIGFTMTYVDFPPPNIEYIEVYLVRRQFQTATRLEPVMIEQGGSAAVSAWVLDQCGGAFPLAATYTATILSGGGRGSLQNPVTLEKGQVLSDLPAPEGYMPTVVFLADGQDADSTTSVEILITPSAAGVEPARVVVPVKPGPTCPVVLLDPANPAPGDTCRIRMMKRRFDGTITEYGPDQLFSVMLYPDEAGTLYSPYRPDTADYFDAVRQDSLMWLTAGEIVEESVSVYLWASEVVPQSRPEKPKLAGGPFLGPDGEMCNAAFASLKKKPFEIMLGETKYYYVAATATGLQMRDDGDPLQPAINRVDDVLLEIRRIEGDRLGVYWDKMYPLTSPVQVGGRTLDSLTGTAQLPAGMIRLTGRFWSQNQSHIVDIAASREGESIHSQVIVVRPFQLGARRSYSTDVYNRRLDVDSLCIALGGEYGIPPQTIKAQAAKESSFRPAYRYEPYTTQFDRRSRSIGSRTPFFVSDDGFGLPGAAAVPTDHVNVLPFLYPSSAKRVWNIVEAYSQLVSPEIPTARAIYGTRESSGRMNFGLYLTVQAIYDSILALQKRLKDVAHHPDQISPAYQAARESLSIYLKESWAGGLQTAASYGLLQLLYVEAIAHGFAVRNELPPEMLNVESTTFPHAFQYQLELLRRAIGLPSGADVDTANNWPSGLERGLERMYTSWNPGESVRLGSSRIRVYGPRVIRNSSLFRPRAN